jgi:hypothetical protein
LDLLPAICPSDIAYTEFGNTAINLTISVLDGATMLFRLYEFTVGHEPVVGFGFAPRTQTAFVTINGTLALDSVARISDFSSGYILRLTGAGGRISLINTGSMPYVWENTADVVASLPTDCQQVIPVLTDAAQEGPGQIGAFAEIPTWSYLFPEKVSRVISGTPAFVLCGSRYPAGWVMDIKNSHFFQTEGRILHSILILSNQLQTPFDRLERQKSTALGRWRSLLPSCLGRKVWSDEQKERFRQKEIAFCRRSALAVSLVRIIETTHASVGEFEQHIRETTSGLANEQTLRCHVSDEISVLFHTVRRSDRFTEFASAALAILRNLGIPKQIICASHSSALDEYDLGPIDAIWIGLNRLLAHPTIVFGGGEGSPDLLESGQITVSGGYVQLGGVNGSYCVDIIPIRLAEHGIGFAVHFVNYLFAIAESDQTAARLLSQQILLPLFEDVQTGSFLLLTTVVGRWFTTALEKKLVPSDLLPDFAKFVRLDSLGKITDRLLATAVTLFSAYVFSNSQPDLDAVRAQIATFCDEVITTPHSIASVVASSLAFELVNPFESRLSLLGIVSELRLPVITNFALMACGGSDPSAVSSAYNALCASLDLRGDSLLFAAALTSGNARLEPSPRDLARLAPSLPPEAARFRMALHALLSILPSFSIPGYSLSSWASPIQANQSRDCVNLPANFPQFAECRDSLSRIFAKLSVLLPIAPIDSGPYFNLFSEKVRMSALLRILPPDFLERGKSAGDFPPALLPRRDAPDMDVFVGFGRWLSWAWRSGKSLPLPISRVVLRFAFGGRLRADDFADVDSEFAATAPTDAAAEQWVARFRPALDAVRAGVAASGLAVADDALLPRVFQLRPFTRLPGVSPATAPLVREAAWRAQLRSGKPRADGRAALRDLAAREFPA